MGRIVSAFACTHTLDPTHFPGEWKSAAVRVGRVVKQIGDAIAASKVDALVIVANDHYNGFSFGAVPAMCVRIGHRVQPMKEYDMPAGVYDHLGKLTIHDELANEMLRAGITSGFELAVSWEAPLDHAFLEPLRYMELGDHIPPLVPIWINCLVSPQPSPARCYRFGELIREVIERSTLNVALLGTGGMYHFPGLDFDRLSESHAEFDRQILDDLTQGQSERLAAYTSQELCDAGEHELLNWTVVAGAVGNSKAEVLIYELCKGLAGIGAVAWPVA